jgi:hypothetical protein
MTRPGGLSTVAHWPADTICVHVRSRIHCMLQLRLVNTKARAKTASAAPKRLAIANLVTNWATTDMTENDNISKVRICTADAWVGARFCRSTNDSQTEDMIWLLKTIDILLSRGLLLGDSLVRQVNVPNEHQQTLVQFGSRFIYPFLGMHGDLHGFSWRAHSDRAACAHKRQIRQSGNMKLPGWPGGGKPYINQ